MQRLVLAERGCASAGLSYSAGPPQRHPARVSSAMGGRSGAFFFVVFVFAEMIWQKPHRWRVKSAKSVSVVRHFFDEAPQRRQRSERNTPGTLFQSFFGRDQPPPFVSATVSQLLIKTIPGYCRGLMRVVRHTNTHSHIEGDRS